MRLYSYGSKTCNLTRTVLVWLSTHIAAAAATLTLSPTTVSNTYTGTITLNVGGLTNGEQVLIQKYLDLNANGVVDPGEPLADSFKLTDGAAVVIGGVTNINVPFDSNPTAGAISASLSIAPPRSLANVVGQYVFVLSSPSQRFSPVTAAFVITNSAMPQSLSGVVYSNGVAPQPYAVIAVLSQPTGNNGGGNWVGGAVADNTGHYHLNLNPGAYMMFPTFPGFFTDESLGAMLTLTNGMSVTNSLYLTNGTVSISGTVTNLTNGGVVPGVLMPVEGGNFLAITFTDTNGTFNAGVGPGTWKIKVDSGMVEERAFVVSQNKIMVDTSTGSVANVSVPVWRANALFYGTFTNTAGQPMANTSFFANDNLGLYEASGISDANGHYCVAVLGGINSWFCSPDNTSPSLAGYIVSTFNSTSLNVSQALEADFAALSATAQISGHVQDSFGNPVTGVGIIATTTVGSVNFTSYIDTDASGNYSLPASTGAWSVFPNCCGNDGLSNFGLTDFGPHPVTIPPTNAVLNITLYPHGTPMLSQASRAGSNFAFLLSGAPGTNYTIQVKTNLTSGNWSTLLVTNMGSFNYLTIQDQVTTGTRFYRALRGP